MRLIYQPTGKAREYADLALNIYDGCDHACTYCYAPRILHKTKEQFDSPRPRFGRYQFMVTARECDAWLLALDRCAATFVRPENINQVLLCFTCDPYQLLDRDIELTREVIKILHSHDFTVCVLTKGGSRAMRDIDLFTPADAFATTLTCLSDERSRTWEPGAALPQDRLATLEAFHNAGIPTWVSLEPVLDPTSSLSYIASTYSFVDLYKLGKLNYHPLANTIDWRQYLHDATQLLDRLGKPYIIKSDLATYLEEE